MSDAGSVARLDAARRRSALRNAVTKSYDVVVIGGGVTGAGAALDAVSRGLSVLLVEARDLASGTSSRSGKLFHGGLRYLEQFNFSLVHEALTERDLMVDRLCPHLVASEPFLIPFTSRLQRPYIGAGVLLYDLLRLTGTRSVRGHRHLTRRSALAAMPALSADGITGAVRYFDVRMDDARHTMTVARTAAGLGAEIVTRAEVVGIATQARRVTGVRIRDGETGDVVEVRARAVVNAAGVWADGVQALAGERTIDVTPAKGVHLVVPADRIDSQVSLIARAGDSVLVIRRWFGNWLIGTTDTRWEHDRGDPAATRSDVDYLLRHTNRWLRRALTEDDVVGVYAGLRPLVTGKGASTAALARDHLVAEGPPGLFTIVGGKYTTYRVMARDVVDAVARHLGGRIPPSCTDRLPLVGAAGVQALRNQRASLAGESGLDAHQIDRLLGRYGTLVTDLLDLMADQPLLAAPVRGAPGYLAAELVYAASSEGALHLDDVLARRTRTAIEAGDGGLAAAPGAARLVGEVLGWDADRQRAEVERYGVRVEADRAALAAPSDEAAISARAFVRAGVRTPNLP